MSSITQFSTPRKVASQVEEQPASSTLVPQDNDLNRLVNEQQAKDVWLMLLVFRCINAALIVTFFQPDEYFQSLEPAWQMAFGPQSGAWITWVSISLPGLEGNTLMESRNGSINCARHYIRPCLLLSTMP
jgi:phosphatidylinositol glycan class B